MQTNTPTANSSYGDGDVQDLINRVDNLEAIVDDQADRIDELESTVDDQQSTINDQADEIEELQQQLDNERDRRSAEVEGCHNRITNEVNEIDDNDDRGDGSSDDNPKGGDGQTTPLETVCALDESTAVRELTSNQRRARAVAKDYTDYARKCPNGLVMKSSEVRRVLTAMEEDTTIYRKTVSRVMEFLSRLGGDGARVVETRSGEKAICMDEELAERVTTVDTVEPEGAVTQAVV